MSKFCVKCGSEKDLVNEFCRGCFSKENSLLKHFKKVNVVICNDCKSYLLKNSWQKPLAEDLRKDIKKVVSKIFRKKIVTNIGVELKEVKVDVDVPKKLKVSRGSLVNVDIDLNVKGSIKNVELEESFVIPLKIKFSTCNTCKKIGGRYFEAKLQIRPKDDKVLRFVEEYCNGRKNLFITKLEDVKHGYDVYLSSQKDARNLGNLLKKKFNGEVKESKKLFGRKEGRDVYRATVLFRLKE